MFGVPEWSVPARSLGSVSGLRKWMEGLRAPPRVGQRGAPLRVLRSRNVDRLQPKKSASDSTARTTATQRAARRSFLRRRPSAHPTDERRCTSTRGNWTATGRCRTTKCVGGPYVSCLCRPFPSSHSATTPPSPPCRPWLAAASHYSSAPVPLRAPYAQTGYLTYNIRPRNASFCTSVAPYPPPSHTTTIPPSPARLRAI